MLLSQDMAIIMQASVIHFFASLCSSQNRLLFPMSLSGYILRMSFVGFFFTWGLVDRTVFFLKYTVFLLLLLFCKLLAVYISEKNISMGRNGGLPL